MNQSPAAPCRRRGAVSRDVPAPKLNLGTGFYDRGWIGVGGGNHVMHQTAQARSVMGLKYARHCSPR